MKGIRFIHNPLSYKPEATFIVHLSHINSKDQLFTELNDKLMLPEYFGFNWDALSDCLRDFHWIEQKGIVLIHDDVPKIDESTLYTYLKILDKAAQDWKEGEEHYFEIVFSEKAESLVNRYLEKI
jgi:RNAse (barnase) inhibitor barstar